MFASCLRAKAKAALAALRQTSDGVTARMMSLNMMLPPVAGLILGLGARRAGPWPGGGGASAPRRPLAGRGGGPAGLAGLRRLGRGLRRGRACRSRARNPGGTARFLPSRTCPASRPMARPRIWGRYSTATGAVSPACLWNASRFI
jgi:hypothetical protein